MTNGNAQQTLNQQNARWLIAVLVANAVVFYLVIKSDSLLITGFGALFKEWAAALATAGLGAIIVRLLTGSSTKSPGHDSCSGDGIIRFQAVELLPNMGTMTTVIRWMR
jgi:hypothetical protein